ncbi:hypothetical protein [Streptomyces sp. 6N223]|uniref:hypothetical protein n=1 Tax=Streptomyces sp. 6N223 TaxID=3457412 RepID=UPI003FD1BF07
MTSHRRATPRPDAAPALVTVDMAAVLNPAASPLLFGLSNEPSRDHQAAVYPQLAASGVTFQRGTLHLNRLFDTPFPALTLQEYRDGTGGVRDAGTWDWGALSWLDHAKAHGITTQLNLLQVPGWLTHTGAVNGIPVDWDVWRHIVTTVVRRCAAKIDSIDILNEPMTDVMIDITGSPFPSQAAAAAQMYAQTVRAVREADPGVLVGGPGEDRHGGDFGAIGTILRDRGLSPTDLQFVSIHSYGADPVGQLRLAGLRRLLSDAGRPALPVYVNEWNHNYAADTSAPEVMGEAAVPFVTDTLLRLARDPSIAGAAFMSALPGNVPLHPDQNAGGAVIRQAIYDWHGSHATLWPQTRAFRLLSVDAGLGAGPFAVCAASHDGLANAAGFVNASGTPGAILINGSPAAQQVEVRFVHLATPDRTVSAAVHTADARAAHGVPPVPARLEVSAVSGSAVIRDLTLPPRSALALVLSG